MTYFAPITGAWIETRKRNSDTKTIVFAPITGAWIETPDSFINEEGEIRTYHGCVD